MKISQNGLNLIKQYEGLRLSAYRDPAGILTIGYGHTRNVVLGQKITEEKAEAFLLEDLVIAQTKVSKLDCLYHWNQNEYDALTSFAFNIGSLTALTKFGTRSKEEIASKMLLYVNAGGKKMQGLVNRRKAEHDLFLTPVPNQDNSYQIGQKVKVIVSGLRLRSEANTKSNEIRKLRKGNTYLVNRVVLDPDGNIWLQIAEGFAAAIYKGKKYIV